MPKTDRSTKTLRISTKVWRSLKLHSTKKDTSMVDLAEKFIICGIITQRKEGKTKSRS
ncbi:hypothetical protein ES708_34562 [subsurface metagenome]